MKRLFLMVIALLFVANLAEAQTYVPKVSKDSVGILVARQEALKASLKVQELKIKEAEEEANVEKLRVKLLEAEGNAKESSAESKNGQSKSVDPKVVDKLAKKAKNDSADAQKALERYNKQVQKVEALSNEIRTEERKLLYKKPLIIYQYN